MNHLFFFNLFLGKRFCFYFYFFKTTIQEPANGQTQKNYQLWVSSETFDGMYTELGPSNLL